MTRPLSESPGTPRLAWSAAFLFAACLCAAAVASTQIAARWGVIPAAAAAGLAALALLLTLIRLLVRQRAAVAGASRRADESGDLIEQIKQYKAELGLRASENQQLQARLQRCVSEIEQREDQRRADLSARSAALEKALDQLVRIQLPLAFSGSTVPPPVPEEVAGGDGELAALCGQVLAAVGSGAAQMHEQLDEQRETSRLAVVALARRVQASAHRIQEEATQMAQRHPADPDVLESSMRVDHAAAQQARHAQSMAVLSGEWPGQQWAEPLALVDVARAAASRIVPYRRVTVSGDPDVAAVARVAEPLIHLVAELLANATQSSPPASQVLVTVRTVQRGAVIEIDDGGVGMDEHRLEQARELASGRRPASLTTLGEIPQTGLAVVGQYARRHGFGVDLVPSPYGGIRAVTLLPADLVQILDPAGMVPARGTARAPALTATPAPAIDVAPAGVPAQPDPAATDPALPAMPGGEPAGHYQPERAAAPGGAAPAEPVPGQEAAALPSRHGRARPGPGQHHPALPDLPPPDLAQPGAAGPGSARPDPAEPDPAEPDPLAAAVTAAGLPQRRSRRDQADLTAARSLTPAPLPAPPPMPAASPAPAPTPAEAGAWMGAFLGSGASATASPAGGGEGGGRRRGQRHKE
jgi:signal transduction histidine kinase